MSTARREGRSLTLGADAVCAYAATWLWDSIPGFAELLAERSAAGIAVRVCLGERDRLWLAVQEFVCTRGRAWACAMGSTTQQEIGGEDARHVELLAAMS